MRIRYLSNTEEILKASRLLVRSPEEMRGHWLTLCPEASRLAMEIGCGKGRFIGEMTFKDPQTLFLGVEKFSTILARSIMNNEAEEPLRPNLRLIRADALDLDEAFADGELDRLYLNFSDPWPKDRHAKRRLTSDRFLPLYARWLKQGGELHFKTDNDALFPWSVESLRQNGWKIVFQTDDWHACPEQKADVMTEYEIQFSEAGKKIHKLTAVYAGSDTSAL